MAAPITVSVITPCYNGARYLQQTLESAARQTRPPLEIIVIDDGSADDSAAIAERFGPPVRVFRQDNRGESAARNRGISEARGSHVLFLDADDLLAPAAIERLVAAIDGRSKAIGLMSCAWFTTDPSVHDHVKEAFPREFYPHIITENIAPPHCWLTPIELVRGAGGFSEAMRWFEDWDLWWRVGLEGPAIVPISYVGALYRQHAQSQLATTKAADRARGHAKLVGRMAAALIERPPLLERHGAVLFWSVWSAIAHSRRAGTDWVELQDTAAVLLTVARRGPREVRTSTAARLFRLVGVRAGLALQEWRALAQPDSLQPQSPR